MPQCTAADALKIIHGSLFFFFEFLLKGCEITSVRILEYPALRYNRNECVIPWAAAPAPIQTTDHERTKAQRLLLSEGDLLAFDFIFLPLESPLGPILLQEERYTARRKAGVTRADSRVPYNTWSCCCCWAVTY